MADWNRITEKPHPAPNSKMWLVSAEWRGGHDRRIFRLHNIFLDEKSAVVEWEKLTPERFKMFYNKKDADAETTFVRFPIRCFDEMKPPISLLNWWMLCVTFRLKQSARKALGFSSNASLR
jgi:hypothetical protein